MCQHCNKEVGDLYTFRRLTLTVTVDLDDIDTAIGLFQSHIDFLKQKKQRGKKDAANS